MLSILYAAKKKTRKSYEKKEIETLLELENIMKCQSRV